VGGLALYFGFSATQDVLGGVMLRTSDKCQYPGCGQEQEHPNHWKLCQARWEPTLTGHFFVAPDESLALPDLEAMERWA